eukprot:GAHX01000470.1.p1 GENE.GAHX01000470.1~~GAHX01000470.1.p1  ORF type:complete len:221 (-),score=46.87 GAHX01000470.1:40-702(-)
MSKKSLDVDSLLPENFQDIVKGRSHFYLPQNESKAASTTSKPKSAYRKVYPLAVKVQKKKKHLKEVLTAPKTIAEFSHTLSKEEETQLYSFLEKLKKETKAQKKQRLLKGEGEFGYSVISGLSQITKLVERKEADLVLIPVDVEPLDLVVWLPSLCRKMDVPFAFVKSKSRAGAVAGYKKCAALALPKSKTRASKLGPQDEAKLKKMIATCHEKFNNAKN